MNQTQNDVEAMLSDILRLPVAPVLKTKVDIMLFIEENNLRGGDMQEKL